jgi:hypothetical protein
MSKELGPGTIMAIVAIAAVVLGLLAWRAFGTPKTPAAQQETRLLQEEEAVRRMPRGGAPLGYPSGR